MNVYPWRTAKRLGIRENQLLTPSTYLQAYDNSKRLVLGTSLLPINVGPIEKNVVFWILDIPATFNMLLECPWIHEYWAFPSLLHQKVKVLIKGEVVIIEGDNLCATVTTRGSVL